MIHYQEEFSHSKLIVGLRFDICFPVFYDFDNHFSALIHPSIIFIFKFHISREKLKILPL